MVEEWCGCVKGAGTGSMLRASEGLMEGPSAGLGFWEGVVPCARATRWRSAGALGGESGIEFGRGDGDGGFDRRVDLDRSYGSSPAHEFVTSFTKQRR